MTIYNSYEAAKIANPEVEIVTTASEWSGIKDLTGKFEALVNSGDDELDACHIIDNKHGWKICNPADHCMTVEKFLVDGYEFVKGDVALIHNGDVKVVENPNLDWNILDSRDNERYILRAAALEEKKPRTKVEYERVSGCIFDLEDDFNSGALYCKQGGEYLNITNACSIGVHLASNGLYRRIETPMTWKEELYNYLDNSCEMKDDFDDSFTIEIEGRPLEFNLSDDEFVDMCKFVSSLNSVN